MRPRHVAASILILVTALAVVLLPAVAQDGSQEYEVLERPPIEDPVEGYTRSDGTTILRDADYCSYLLGAIWGTDELTPRRLIDGSRQQRRAKRAAFSPVSDEAVLARCAEALNAFRVPLAEDDPLPAWARGAAVVPEAFAVLLPPDLLADPLAEPDPVGDGTRTLGFGERLSAPFGLSGGTYFVQVDAPGCPTWSGTIRGIRDQSLEFGPVESRGYLYDVVPATYYWDVTAPECDWSVDLVAVDLGPEPTPTPVPRAVVPKLIGDPSRAHENLENPEFLSAAAAREAVLAAGLTTGECTLGEVRLIPPGRIVTQDPPPGTLLELGSPVDVQANADCDVYVGDRVILE